MKNSEPNCIYLEKAFDSVPREVNHFALRRKGVAEFWQMKLYLFKKIVKLLSQLMGNFQVHFL